MAGTAITVEKAGVCEMNNLEVKMFTVHGGAEQWRVYFGRLNAEANGHGQVSACVYAEYN